jgi:hypothetical protein
MEYVRIVSASGSDAESVVAEEAPSGIVIDLRLPPKNVGGSFTLVRLTDIVCVSDREPSEAFTIATKELF